MVDIDELRELMVDKYTAAEIVERLGMSTEELLDMVMEQVYTNLTVFDELDYLYDDINEEDNEYG